MRWLFGFLSPLPFPSTHLCSNLDGIWSWKLFHGSLLVEILPEFLWGDVMVQDGVSPFSELLGIAFEMADVASWEHPRVCMGCLFPLFQYWLSCSLFPFQHLFPPVPGFILEWDWLVLFRVEKSLTNPLTSEPPSMEALCFHLQLDQLSPSLGLCLFFMVSLCSFQWTLAAVWLAKGREAAPKTLAC